MEKKKIGVYLHIPFCIRKCPYCGFFSKVLSKEGKEAGKCEYYEEGEYTEDGEYYEEGQDAGDGEEDAEAS